jgi:O-antigen/teichoic acid export membrane protein
MADARADTTDAAEATTGATVLRGGAWNAASMIIPQLYVLIMSVVAARFLGPAGLGRQSYIAFVAQTVAYLFTAGLPVALMRYVGQTLGEGRAAAVRGLLSWAWRIQAVAALLGGTVLLIVGYRSSDHQAAWALAAAASAMAILQTLPSAVLIGMQRWRPMTVLGLLTGLAGTVATVAALEAGWGITGMFMVEAVVVLVQVTVTAALARRALQTVAPVRGPAGDLPRRVLRFAAGASLGVVLTLVVWRRSEFFFLNRYSNDAEIAMYSIAFAAMTALGNLPTAISGVLSPAIATLLGAGESERIRSGFSRSIRLVALLTIGMTAGMLALGPLAFEVVYGPAYRPAGRILLIMLAFFPVVPLINLGNALFVGLGKQAFPLAVGAAGALVNVLLAFLLIPRHGAAGAALANGGAQLVAGVPLIVWSNRLLGPFRWEWAALGRAVVVGAGAAAAAWAAAWGLGGVAGLCAGALVGIGSFLVLAMVLRILPQDDAQWLEEALGARLGRRVRWICRRCAWRIATR